MKEIAMCKASIEALNTRDAEEGDRTVLTHSPHGFPQFQRKEDGTGPEATVTCALMGQRLRLSNIPLSAQLEHGIEHTIAATFVEDAGDMPDQLFLEDGRLIDFDEILWGHGKVGLVEVEMLDMMNDHERREMLDAIYNRQNPEAPTAAEETTLVNAA